MNDNDVDDLARVLAEHYPSADRLTCLCGSEWHPQHQAEVVLASGVVVSARDVKALADHWAHSASTLRLSERWSEAGTFQQFEPATDATPVMHDESCEEWCNHCEVCGTGIMWGSRCHQHPNRPATDAAPTRCCDRHHTEGCTDGGPGCCRDCPINPAPAGEHVCAECPDCIHNGNKCCGCYDGFCCRDPESGHRSALDATEPADPYPSDPQPTTSPQEDA